MRKETRGSGFLFTGPIWRREKKDHVYWALLQKWWPVFHCSTCIVSLLEWLHAICFIDQETAVWRDEWPAWVAKLEWLCLFLPRLEGSLPRLPGGCYSQLSFKVNLVNRVGNGAGSLWARPELFLEIPKGTDSPIPGPIMSGFNPLSPLWRNPFAHVIIE